MDCVVKYKLFLNLGYTTPLEPDTSSRWNLRTPGQRRLVKEGFKPLDMRVG
jgi:hypothetical protein